MANLGKVQHAVKSVAASGKVSNLSVRTVGDAIEIHGTVESVTDKHNVMKAITNIAGGTDIINKMEVG